MTNPSSPPSAISWRKPRFLNGLPSSPLALVLIGVAVAAGVGNYLAGEASRAEGVRQHAILTQSDRLLGNMVELETGMRGFVLLGEEAYLEPYEAAQGAIDGQLTAIDDLTRDMDTRSPEHMRALREAVAAKRSYAARVIGLRRTRGYDPAVAVVAPARASAPWMRCAPRPGPCRPTPTPC